MIEPRPSTPHLVLVGAGHAHLHSLARLDAFARQGVAVTVVSTAPFWYSGMGPGLLSGQYEAADASVDVRTMVENRGGRFIDGRVAAIDAERRSLVTESGEELSYDVLSLNIGSTVAGPSNGAELSRLFPVKPVSGFLDLRHALLDSGAKRTIRLIVVGGGPAGCEAAANARALCVRQGRRADIRLVSATDRLLPGLPPVAGARMAVWFQSHGIAVDTGRRVAKYEANDILFADGSRSEAEFVVLATGVHPPGLLRGSGLVVDDDGALLVDRHLQSISHPGVFGGGDCICFQPRALDRVGVHAVRQGPVLFGNLLAALCGGRMRAFSPQRRYVLILNLGDATGLLVRGAFVASGRLAFHLKKWLDNRFVDRYQRAVRLAMPRPGAHR